MEGFRFSLSDKLKNWFESEGIKSDIIYEVKYDCKHEDYCHVCFEDDEKVWNEITYKKSDVDKFIESGEWIKITT